MSFWERRRATVTGGAGFLGSYVVQGLRERGCSQIFIPRSGDYDLVDAGAVRRLFDDARPSSPGKFWTGTAGNRRSSW